MLETDLGVSSALHRRQIVRAMQAQLMGAYRVPSPPLRPEAEPLQCSQIEVRWSRPADLGEPHAHLYVLQRRAAGRRTFVTVGTSPEDDFVWEDSDVAPRQWYAYRVVAWSPHGCSDPSEETAEVRAPPACAGQGAAAGGWPAVATALLGVAAASVYALRRTLPGGGAAAPAAPGWEAVVATMEEAPADALPPPPQQQPLAQPPPDEPSPEGMLPYSSSLGELSLDDEPMVKKRRKNHCNHPDCGADLGFLVRLASWRCVGHMCQSCIRGALRS